MTHTFSNNSSPHIHPEDIKRGLLNDLFLSLPETGVFDGADSQKHRLIATTLLSLKIPNLEDLIELAESDPEGFQNAIQNLLESTAATQRKIHQIFNGILLSDQGKK